MTRTASVYYCYAVDGTLLYVGSSVEPATRIYLHSGYYGSDWMIRHCTHVVVDPPLPERQARRVERREIARLHPVFNRQHNPAPQCWTPIDRPDGPTIALPAITYSEAAGAERQTA